MRVLVHLQRTAQNSIVTQSVVVVHVDGGDVAAVVVAVVAVSAVSLVSVNGAVLEYVVEHQKVESAAVIENGARGVQTDCSSEKVSEQWAGQFGHLRLEQQYCHRDVPAPVVIVSVYALHIEVWIMMTMRVILAYFFALFPSGEGIV